VVGAVEGEVPQSPEVALDAVQERCVGGHVGELDVVGCRPVAHPAVFFGRQVRAEVIHHDGDAHLGWVQRAQVTAKLKEGSALLVGLHVPVELVGVNVESSQQVAGPQGALVGGPSPPAPGRGGGALVGPADNRRPLFAGTGQQVERPELVHGEHHRRVVPPGAALPSAMSYSSSTRFFLAS
jgi:hypothetical protein